MNVAKLFLCLAITSFIACTTEIISERDPSGDGGNSYSSGNSDNSNPSSSSSNGQTYKTKQLVFLFASR
jgi:hypothetical protein